MKETTITYLPSVQIVVDEEGKLLSYNIDWSSSFDAVYDDDGDEVEDQELVDKLVSSADKHLDDLVLANYSTINKTEEN